MAILDLKTKIHACRWCTFLTSKGVFLQYKKDFSERYKKDFSDKYARVRQMRNHPMQGVFLRYKKDFLEQYESESNSAFEMRNWLLRAVR